ncbi:MAG TPA: transporter substrate-binding domain-containing protein [Stellaceae bacterium]
MGEPSGMPDFLFQARSQSALALCVLAAAGLCLSGPAATARSLQAISDRGSITMCAHPNALPFASKRGGDMPGFQVELGEAIAAQLGVSLARQWVITPIQFRRADCDIVMDAIADREAQSETGLRLSKPYYRSGVVLAVRDGDSGGGGGARIASFRDLEGQGRVGVQVGSVASMVLNRRGVDTSPFLFEDDMMEALLHREIVAAVVSPATAGYFNLTHADRAARLIAAADADADPGLSWNVAVGMIKPDARLREAVDEALDKLMADGTIARIYARYGVVLQPPG